MRFVLDQNMSRKPELSEHLENGHEIVLIDEFFVEIFKATDPVQMFNKNTKIIREYPSSIYYGKSRGELVRQEIVNGAPLSKEDLICEENTQEIRNLILLNYSNSRINQFKLEAKKREEESLMFSEEYIRGISAKADLLDIKQYRDAPELLKSHMYDVSIAVLEMVFKEKYGDSFNAEIFKFKKSVSYIVNYILLWRCLDWANKKGYDTAKKLRNDNGDLKYVLTSCFFDGLLTKESWLIECRESALSSVEAIAVPSRT